MGRVLEEVLLLGCIYPVALERLHFPRHSPFSQCASSPPNVPGAAQDQPSWVEILRYNTAEG